MCNKGMLYGGGLHAQALRGYSTVDTFPEANFGPALARSRATKGAESRLAICGPAVYPYIQGELTLIGNNNKGRISPKLDQLGYQYSGLACTT